MIKLKMWGIPCLLRLSSLNFTTKAELVMDLETEGYVEGSTRIATHLLRLGVAPGTCKFDEAVNDLVEGLQPKRKAKILAAYHNSKKLIAWEERCNKAQ